MNKTVTSSKIATLGEIVVEIMAEDRGRGFRSPLRLTGPYPSGAPAIFIDQVARLGMPCGIISAVGDDDFGALTTERLREDGVDVSAVAIHPDRPTATAFVRYREDGERDFVFNIRHSAAGSLALTPAAQALLAGSSHLHLMGSSLASPELATLAQEAVTAVRRAGGSVSFDPNLRRELLTPAVRAALAALLRQCDLFLPSGPAHTALTEARDEPGALAELFSLGVKEVVIKRGRDGAEYHRPGERCHTPAFPVQEVDPTGAGDCFGATFVACRLMGRSVADSLRYAAASGALATSRRGPMEGAAGFPLLDAVIARGRVA